MSASSDPRKGKPGQSCAECRRSVFHIFSSLRETHWLIRPTPNAQVEAQMRQVGYSLVFLGTRSTMNMGKETFLVSPVLEEVARLYVQMVSFYVPVGFRPSPSSHIGTLAATRGNK
jgi:hypothetical protein